jgi:hypothetical protein
MTANKQAAPGQWADQQRIQQEKEDKKELKKGNKSQQMTQGDPDTSDDFPVDGEQAQERRDQMQQRDKPEGNQKD